MKLVSKFLNLLMMCILFCMATAVEWGVYNLISLPAGQTSTISLVEQDTNQDGYADNVTYFDTFTFLADDLGKSVTREPRFVIRSWFKWDWWQNGMRWADVALEAVVGATVPVFAPVYEIKEIQYYYTGEHPVYAEIGNGAYCVNGLYVLNQSEIQKINPTSEGYDELFVQTFEAVHGTHFAYAEFSNPVIVDGNYQSIVTGGSIYKIHDGKVEEVTYWVRYGSSENFISNEWKKENRTFINTLLKINKYNEVDEDGNNVYTKWVMKFMEDDSAKTIKSSACSLYFQFYLAVILAIWFRYQNPIVIKRNEYGQDEVSGGFRRRVRTDKEKKDKKHRRFFHRKKKEE